MGDNNWWKRTAGGVIISSFEDYEKVIFLDTNFLMAMGQMKAFNLPFELDRVFPGKRKLVILKPIFNELLKLSTSGKIKVEREAQFALSFVNKECEIWDTDYDHKNIDFILLEYVQRYNGVIATNDRKLKRLARRKGLQTVFIRNQAYLMLE